MESLLLRGAAVTTDHLSVSACVFVLEVDTKNRPPKYCLVSPMKLQRTKGPNCSSSEAGQWRLPKTAAAGVEGRKQEVPLLAAAARN